LALVAQTYPSPLTGANTYADLAYFKAYHTLRLNSYVAYQDSQIEAALVKAWGYLDMRFKYIGWRQTVDQNTEWPRDGAFNDRQDLVTGIPSQVKDAQCEYTLRALVGNLIPDPSLDDTGQVVKKLKEKVGPIETEVEFDVSEGIPLPAYPYADNLLKQRGLVLNDQPRNGIGHGTTARG
jgi:hypothetical protein